MRAPVLVELPPLPPAPRSSTVMAPVAIALSAIRDAADRGAPRNFNGKADNPISQILENADIGWTASRGPISATGAQDVLTLATPLTGTLNVTGSLSAKATGAVGDALGGLLGGNVAKQIGSINIKNLNASAEIKGNVAITCAAEACRRTGVSSRISAARSISATPASRGRRAVNVPAQVKPLIDKTVADQLDAVAGAHPQRSDLRENARAAMGQGLPLDPAARHRSLARCAALARDAADPRDRRAAARRCTGRDADARHRGRDPHHPGADQAGLPVSRQLTIVPPTPAPVAIGVPIDMPFTEINKIVEAQFAGKHLSGGRLRRGRRHREGASIAASGDRLLISLLVNAKEKASYFGLGGEANVHIWGRPVLDQAEQTLRLTDIQLAVESEAAFGLLGAAARAACRSCRRRWRRRRPSTSSRSPAMRRKRSPP